MPVPCTPWHVHGCWLAASPDHAGRYELRQKPSSWVAIATAAPDWPETVTVLLVGLGASPTRKADEIGNCERFATVAADVIPV